MSNFDLDEVKLKTPDEMSDEEKDFLRENKEELTDGDKEDYKDILEEKEEPEKEEEGDDKEVVEEGDKEEKEEAAKHSFKTDEELEAYYKERQEKEKAERKRAKEDSKISKGEYFPKDYKPADWNEYTSEVLKIIRNDRSKFAEDQRKNITKINQRLDDETEELRGLPGIAGIPAKGTKARITFDTEITNIMLRDKSVSSVAKAFKVMQEAKQEKTEVKEKKESLAKKIGSSAGTAEETKDVEYKKFASRNLDDAAEAALAKFNKLS